MSEYFNPTLFWAILGIVLLVLELMTGTFILIFFAVSALFVAGMRVLGLDNLAVETLLFAADGVLALFLFRKFFKGREAEEPTTAGGFIIDRESTFRLSETIPARGEGPISYQGSLWTAVNNSDSPLTVGTEVKIKSVAGIKLHVEKYNG